MESAAQTAVAPAQKSWMTWTGRILSALPVLLMGSGLYFAFFKPQESAAGMAHFGYASDRLRIILTLELVSLALYLIPQTAIFGAILLTAYLGGAVATHVRIADPGWPMAVIAATCIWLGLYFREPRLRALVPFRKA
jgi:hypothetical protein